MTTMTLIEFLLARIAEDEAEAEQVARARGADGEDRSASLWWCDNDGRIDGDHVAASPARVLAECEAKRITIETCRYWLEHQEPDTDVPEVNADYIFGATELATSVLSTVATAYKDHPDWREEFDE